MINSKAGIKIIQCERVEDRRGECSNLVLVQIATHKQNCSAVEQQDYWLDILQSVTSYPQLVDNFSLVVGGHRAPVLAGVCEVGGEDEKVVATSSLLQPVLTAGLAGTKQINVREHWRDHWWFLV